MRCDACGAGDSLFVVVSGNSQGETRLCKACALEKGYLADDGGAALPQLESILDQFDNEGETGESCPHCGMEPAQLSGSGRLGCPACVQAFRRLYLLARKRRGLPVGYAGKVPRNFASEPGAALIGNLVPATGSGIAPFGGSSGSSQLLADIESAVLAEDFEKAAFLRDCLGVAKSGGKPGNVT